MQRISGDVEPQPAYAVGFELDHRANDVRQQQVGQTGTVPAGNRRDAQPLPSTRHLALLPCGQTVRRIEPPAPQPPTRLRCRHDGQPMRQSVPRHPVEVVAMQMRQEYGVERRKLVHCARGIREPAGPRTVTEMHPAAGANEVGVGQDSEVAQPQNGRRVADERHARLHTHRRTRSRGEATLRIKGRAVVRCDLVMSASVSERSR